MLYHRINNNSTAWLDLPYLSYLVNSPDPQKRWQLAQDIAQFLIDNESSREDIASLTPLAVQLANDEVFEVRAALAEPLTRSLYTPRAVIYAQLVDHPDIALPYLRYSPALNDQDLSILVSLAGERPEVQEAIAWRKSIGPKSARALIEHATRQICAIMLENPRAQIDEETFELCFEAHGKSPRIRAILSERTDLPVMLRAKVTMILADKLYQAVEDKNWVDNEEADDMRHRTHERALVGLSLSFSDDELAELITNLHEDGKLTHSIILHAACAGNMAFIAEALSLTARVPLSRIHGFLKAKSNFGMGGICRRAGLSREQGEIIAISLEAFRKMARNEFDLSKDDEDRFGKLMIEHILTGHEKTVSAKRFELLDIIAHHAAPNSARLASKLINELGAAA